MRKSFALVLCAACLSGCAGFRQHLADGPGHAIYQGTGKAARYAPTAIVGSAFAFVLASLSEPFNDEGFDE